MGGGVTIPGQADAARALSEQFDAYFHDARASASIMLGVSPNNTAVTVAQALAAGNISTRIEIRGRDEMTLLLGAMRDMIGSFKRFAAAQQELADQHRGGNVDYSIDAAAFPGIYGEMARAANKSAIGYVKASSLDDTVKAVIK